MDSVEVKVSKDKKSINVSFPEKIDIKKSGIRYAYIQAIPPTYNYETYRNSHHMHGVKQVKLQLNKVSQNINLELVRGHDFSNNYPIKEWDINLVVNTYSETCFEGTKLQINLYHFSAMVVLWHHGTSTSISSSLRVGQNIHINIF